MNKSETLSAVSSMRLLGSLTDAQLDHLCLGLTHNFGATITRPKELGGELLIIETEDGTRMGIAAGCTEMDAWKIAEAAFYADGVPAHVPGVRNVLPNDGTQRPGSPDGSLATETRKPGSLK